MKKSVFAAAAAAIMAVSAVTAYADTEIKESTDPKTAQTTVSLTKDSMYTVIIPETIDLPTKDGTTGKYSGADSIVAKNVNLEEGQTLTVSVASPSGFLLKAGTTELPYTATGSAGTITDKTNGGVAATFQNSAADQTQTISFETDTAPDFAGSYTDTLVFTITVE